MSKKVAIIGAGASGLSGIKCCLDEGLEPVCYERTDHIGGLWRYTDDINDGQACVSRSTVINTSKEMMCFSDFPIPKEFPIFMHNTYVYKYFNMYADRFGLKPYIHFHTEIVLISKADDFDQTGQWKVEIRDTKSRKTEIKIFDGVLVCTGHHAEKNIPSFNGLEDFRGKVLHSHDYKDTRGYENKRIVIVGIGNSGGDAAAELSRTASQVFLSTRRGSWLLNRVSDDGLPFDMLNTTRVANFMISILPLWFLTRITLAKLRQRINHDLYSLTPKHGIFSQHPLVNDDLPNRLACGSVVIKADIKRITKTGVEFVDGTFEDNIDVMFLATGYRFGFPFIDKSVIDVKENKADLFKYMYPPQLDKKTLAVIGYIQPLGAIMPIAELQCRLACRVIKGDVKLPSASDMMADIHMKRCALDRRYVKSLRHTIQVDWIPYMDELAKLTGCMPNIKTKILTDPRLAYELIFGPGSPYQYRLRGHGKWDGARKAILTQWERTFYPLRTRDTGIRPGTSYWKHVCFFSIIGVIAYLAKLYEFF
ncbi:hypothetical protein ScPMuIL_010448 [Solemya velum]